MKRQAGGCAVLVVCLALSCGCAGDRASATGGDASFGGDVDAADLYDAAGDDSGPPPDVRDSSEGPSDVPGIEDADREVMEPDLPDADMGPDMGGLVAVEPPPAPPTSATVETISIGIVTGPNEFNGTPNPIEVCVGDVCFPFAIDEVQTTQRGAASTVHFMGADANRDALDTVSLRILGNNAWRPSCLEVRLDGVPVQCADLTGTILSGDPEEAPSDTWTGLLQEACTTCQAGKLTHGTVLGLPDADAVRVWARTDATRLVGLELAEAPDGPWVPVAWAYPTPATDFAVVLEAGALEPDAQYWYRVSVDREPGPGRPVRTAPPADAEVSIGVGSCAKHPEQHPAMFTQLASKPMDAFLFVGDTQYGNVQNRQAHWHHIRRLRAIEERANFFSEVPVATIWDDHDFLGNNSNSACRGREEALDAFGDYWPNPGAGLPQNPGVYFRHRLGPADLFMLDCRYHRPDVGDIARNCDVDGPGSRDHAAGPLGEPQFAWLMDGLSASDAPFKIVACGSLVSGDSTDSWFSFPEAKERLLSGIHQLGVGGVVFVSGDIHRSEAKVIDRQDGYDFVEVISSPLAQYPRNGLPRTQCDTPREGRLYCDAYNSFVVMRIDGGADDPEFQALFYDEFGEQRFALIRRLSELTNGAP